MANPHPSPQQRLDRYLWLLERVTDEEVARSLRSLVAEMREELGAFHRPATEA